MEGLLNFIPKLMDKVKRTEDWMNEVYPMKYNPFTEIHNTLFLLLETLNWLYNSWDIKSQKTLSKTQKAIITTITRWGYIATFSVIEFTIKIIIKNEEYDEFLEYINLWKENKFVGFGNIISKFKNMDKITDDELSQWDTLREIRNCIVHNNGFTDKNILFKRDDEIIVFTENNILKGPLDGFIMLIEQITKLYSLFLYNLFK